MLAIQTKSAGSPKGLYASLLAEAAGLLTTNASSAHKVYSHIPPFTDWLKRVTPTWSWEWAHLAYVREYLDRVTAGEITRLMLFLPPRHGKSEQVTVRYPVWRLEREPHLRVIVGAYNQMLANKFSRKMRRLAEGRLELAGDRKAVEDWELQDGGGVRAVGVGAGITGQGGNLIVIDDPVKSREEAASEAYRERVWEWYTDDLYTRLEPGGAIILIMTRWHTDDLAGRILASEDGPNWTVVSLPAEAEEDDPLGRAPGEALCPERFDEERLADIHSVLGNSYYALYQQRPQPREGDMFKRYWFEIVDAAPMEAVRVRWWDNAGSEGKGDYTVGLLMARDYRTGLYFVEEVVRGQWAATEREAVKKATAQRDAAKYGNRVQIWNEQEPGSSGKDMAQATIKSLQGYPVFAEPSTGDKVLRAEPFAAQAGAGRDGYGNVKLVRGAWNGPYLDELTAFPTGKHKDQVDGSSGAFNKLALTTVTTFSASIGGQRQSSAYVPR